MQWLANLLIESVSCDEEFIVEDWYDDFGPKARRHVDWVLAFLARPSEQRDEALAEIWSEALSQEPNPSPRSMCAWLHCALNYWAMREHHPKRFNRVMAC
jgi:hypothetical protein